MENTLNQRLKLLRRKNDETQKQMAFRLGITGQQISNIEIGKSGLSTGLAEKISSEYQVSLEWVLSGAGEGNLKAGSTKTKEEEIHELREMITWQRDIINKLLGIIPDGLSAKLLGNRERNAGNFQIGTVLGMSA